MKIGEVSEQLGIASSAIRYYEQVGLIDRQGRVAGRREFNQKAVFMLQFVQLAQAAGFTISEIKTLLDNYSEDPGPAGMWKEGALTKQASIREQIKALRKMDKILDRLIGCECKTLEACVRSACLTSRQKRATSH